jgi:hypothetical protein
VKAFLELALGTSGTVKSGDAILLLAEGYQLLARLGSHSFIYGAFITATGPIFGLASVAEGGYTVTVRWGVNGQRYVVLAGCGRFVNDDMVAAGLAIVEVTNL